MQDNVVDQLRRTADDDSVPTKVKVGYMAAVIADMHDNQHKANLARIANKEDTNAKFLARDDACGESKKELDGRLDVLESRDKKSIAWIAGGTSTLTAVIIFVGTLLFG